MDTIMTHAPAGRPRSPGVETPPVQFRGAEWSFGSAIDRANDNTPSAKHRSHHEPGSRVTNSEEAGALEGNDLTSNQMYCHSLSATSQADTIAANPGEPTGK